MKIHGQHGTLAYHSWQGMKGRCYNPNNNRYQYYGARGITVCARWFDSYLNFLEDMGNPPTDKHSIDRIDTNGNYEPSNCRWATSKEQANNRRKSRKHKIHKDALTLTCNGVTKTVAEWLKESSVGKNAIRERLKRGWSHEDTIFKPGHQRL